MQTGDKHVSVTQDGIIMVSVGIKRSVCYPVRWEPKAVIGSHGDKIWLKLCKRQIQFSYHRSRCGYAEMNEATARQDGNRNESTQTQRFDKIPL
jgi:hypothetical protein